MAVVLEVRDLWKGYAAGVQGCSARVWVLRGAALALVAVLLLAMVIIVSSVA